MRRSKLSGAGSDAGGTGGAAVGAYYGGPAGAAIGGEIGAKLGSFLDNSPDCVPQGPSDGSNCPSALAKIKISEILTQARADVFAGQPAGGPIHDALESAWAKVKPCLAAKLYADCSAHGFTDAAPPGPGNDPDPGPGNDPDPANDSSSSGSTIAVIGGLGIVGALLYFKPWKMFR